MKTLKEIIQQYVSEEGEGGAPTTSTRGFAGIQPNETPPVSPKKRKTQMFVRKPQ